MLRYEKAVENLLGGKPKISLCFLGDHESVNLIPGQLISRSYDIWFSA